MLRTAIADANERHTLFQLWRRAFTVDLRALAAFRVITAIVLIYCQVQLFPDAIWLISDDGVIPRDLLIKRGWYPWSLLNLNGSSTFAKALIVASLFFAIGLLIGYRTKFCAIASFILFTSTINRNPVMAQGGDSLLIMMLLWCVLLPIANRFAVDAALDPKRNEISNTFYGIASVGLVLQVSYVYFFGALLKTGPEWWDYGSAVYITTRSQSLATPLAAYMGNFPFILQVLTYSVLIIELAMPFLVFAGAIRPQIRTVALLMLIFMHLGFRAFIDIGHFWIVSIATLVALLPSTFMDEVAQFRSRGSQRHISVYYDGDCSFCRKVCLIIREFCLPKGTSISKAQSATHVRGLFEAQDSWVVETPKGLLLTKWNAVIFVLKQSIVTMPAAIIAWTIDRVHLGDRLYRWIGDRRNALGNITSWALPERSNVPRLGWPTFTFALLFIILCFLANIESVMHSRYEKRFMPTVVRTTMSQLSLWQYWTMFAPSPRSMDIWPQISATVDGKTIFLNADGSLRDKPSGSNYDNEFKNERWRKYATSSSFDLQPNTPNAYLPFYAEMICRKWNRSIDGMTSVTIGYVNRRILSHGKEHTTIVSQTKFYCPSEDKKN